MPAFMLPAVDADFAGWFKTQEHFAFEDTDRCRVPVRFLPCLKNCLTLANALEHEAKYRFLGSMNVQVDFRDAEFSANYDGGS